MSLHYAYFDYAASTPLDPSVHEVMNDFALRAGNPSAIHGPGRELRFAIDDARRQVANFLGGEPIQVTFTSGATEANNLAIFSHWEQVKKVMPAGLSPRILTTNLEHASVSRALSRLAQSGAEIVVLPVSSDGLVKAEVFFEAMTPGVVLVTLPWVNNVFGTRQPVEEVGALVIRERAVRGKSGVPIVFHCDAVQAARFETLRPEQIGVDYLSLSAHKLYGPKGIGCLWSRDEKKVSPLLVGGGQESGRRSGTENISGIVGFGLAASLVEQKREADAVANRSVQGDIRRFVDETKGLSMVGSDEIRVSGTAFLRHDRISGDELALRLDASGVAVSTGSACEAGSRKASELMKEVLGTGSAVNGGIRLSWGRFTGDDGVARLLEALPASLRR